MNKPRILIISEGGKRAGMGHLVRVSSVIDALSASFDITLLIDHDRCGRHFLKKCGIPFHAYDDYAGMMRFIKAAGPYTLVIIDMLHISRRVIKKIGNNCKSLLVFDDMHRFEDSGINGAVVRPQETFKRNIRSTGRTSLVKGTDFFSLRPAFLSSRGSKIFKAAVKDVGIILGGAPSLKDVSLITRLLDGSLDKDVSIHVVTGYAKTGMNKGIFSKRVKFYGEVADMAAFIRKIDLGIISGGFIKFEFMCIGTPFCLVSLNAHQDVLAKKFANDGYGIHLGNIKDIRSNPQRFYNKFEYLISSGSLRKKMFLASRKLVDGKGRERLAVLIKNLIKKGKI